MKTASLGVAYLTRAGNLPQMRSRCGLAGNQQAVSSVFRRSLRQQPRRQVGIALLLIFASAAAPAFALGIADVNSYEASAAGKESPAENTTGGEPATPQTKPKKPSPSYMAEDWTVVLYPILVWAPVMGDSISMPDVPVQPGGGVSGGNVSGGLEGAHFLGFGVQKNWLEELERFVPVKKPEKELAKSYERQFQFNRYCRRNSEINQPMERLTARSFDPASPDPEWSRR